MSKLSDRSPGAAIASGTAALPRLLFVSLSLDVGGAERHLSSVLPGLVARGWPVSLFCMNRLGAYAPAVREQGVDVIGPPIERQPGQQGLIGRFRATVMAGSRLSSTMRRLEPSIVHFFLPEPYLIGAPIALLRRVPICLMSRRGLNLYQRNWPGAGAIERRLHPQMTAVLANSRRVVADLVAEGCAPARVGLIYNGVAITGLEPGMDREATRASLGLAPDDLVAIVVANLIPYKGHADILHALAGELARLPPNLKVVCIGRDEGARAGLEDLRARLGLDGRVHFLGVRNDVPALLAAADMSILASHEEGFSNAVIEAMAAGLPMVVSDVGGNAEAILDGETGLVVPSKAPAELGVAIRRLAGDDVLRRRFGAAARDRARDEFSLSACIDRYDALYRGLLAGRSLAEMGLAAP
jgi:glycosyltransferase involved in cell wall biosynthesis